MSQQQTVGSHKTTVSMIDGMTTVVYHRTAVVRFDSTKIILNSGGWETVTTKARMNQTSNQFGLGYGVFQKNYEWFVDYKGEKLDFVDGMELQR